MTDLLLERDGQVATLTLNRPDRLNAITGDMLTGLSTLLLECDQDPEIRVLILTGAGRGFCAGLDLKQMSDGSSDPAGASRAMKIGEMPPMVLRRIDTPIVCALNGPASGYGMDLALGCDLVLASDRAAFALALRRGLLPESGGTWLLPRLVGWHKACEVVLMGKKLDATEIERLGLANRVVPHEELMDEARRWAGAIASNAPLAVAAAKRTMRLGLDSGFETNALHAMSELQQLFGTEDVKEGIASFLEKREPKFQGR